MFKKGIYVIFSAIMLLSACGTEPETQGENGAITNIDDNQIINMHGNVKNLERLDKFVERVGIGRSDEIRLTHYTIEGDPIYDEISFDGKELNIIHDTSEDKFGANERTTIICKNIERSESETFLKYMLIDCEAEDGTGGSAPILSIDYNLAEQDFFAFRLEFGVGQKNIIDTKEQNLVKDLQNGELVNVSDFQFTQDELQQIYKLLVLAGYLGEKQFTDDCQVEPHSSYKLKVWINQAEREYGWNRCDKSPDGNQMTKLADDIFQVLKKNETYKQLPEIKGYYE
jgi:hypothetical protein